MKTDIAGVKPDAQELVARARESIGNLTVEQLADELQAGRISLVDVREQSEREWHGVIPGSVHIPRGVLEFCCDPALPVYADELDPAGRVVLYCASGNRSALAAVTLQGLGFSSVAHLDGGFESWRLAGGAVELACRPSAEAAPRWWAVLCATTSFAT